MVAFASVLGFGPWPDRFDPAAIWFLCLPATIAYVGEALGWFRYRPRWQSTMMLITSVAFGKALSYELENRWNPRFWAPVAFFGLVWFTATVIGVQKGQKQ